MRTTLTLDDDVVFGLQRVKELNPQKPFKAVVNDVLRKGLMIRKDKIGKKRFKVEPLNLGLRSDLNFDKIEDVLDILEGPNRR